MATFAVDSGQQQMVVVTSVVDPVMEWVETAEGKRRPGNTQAMSSSVPDAPVAVPSMGDVLRVAPYVTDLVGNDRVRGVKISSAGTVHIDVPDPFHAATLAGLLGMSRPRRDLPPAADSESTGVGAHSYWKGLGQGVPVSVESALRPGVAPEPCPRTWPTTADGVKAVS